MCGKDYQFHYPVSEFDMSCRLHLKHILIFCMKCKEYIKLGKCGTPFLTIYFSFNFSDKL